MLKSIICLSLLSSISLAGPLSKKITECKKAGGGDCLYDLLIALDSQSSGGETDVCVGNGRDLFTKEWGTCCYIHCWGPTKAVCKDAGAYPWECPQASCTCVAK